MDAFKKLKQIFPDANEDTSLVILSPSTRIRIGKVPVHLAPYQLGSGQSVYAAYSPEKNQIYLRLVDFENPFSILTEPDKISTEKTKEKEQNKLKEKETS